MKPIFKECPKCGCKDINIEYRYDVYFAEYLKMTCRRCNYTWKENCLDHEKTD